MDSTIATIAITKISRKNKEKNNMEYKVNDKLKNTVISPFTDRMLYAGAF